MQRIFIDSEFQELIDQIQQDRIQGDFEKLKEDAKKLKEESIRSGNTYAQSVSSYFLAIYNMIYNEPMKCILYCDEIKEKYKQHKSHYLYVAASSLAGSAYVHVKDHQNAICYLLDGYYVSLENSFIDLQIQILNNIGSLFYELGNYKKAIEYYTNANEIIQKYHYTYRPQIEMLFVNMSSSYVRINEFEKAKYWEQQYLERCGKSDNPLIHSALLVNHILMKNISDIHSELTNEVQQFLESIRKGSRDVYSIQLLFEVVEFCLRVKNIELSKESIELVEDKVEEYNGYVYREHLSSVKIQFYQLTGEEEALYKELIQYHEFVRKREEEKKEIETFGLLSKISLEEAEYQRKKIELQNQELQKKNELDDFTGLLNKTTFEKKVQDYLLDRVDGTGKDILLIVDLDNFKAINDMYGHLAGDEVLKKISNTLKEQTRYSDYVGRIGGDEFAIFLLNMPNRHSVEKWILELINRIQELKYNGIGDRKVTISIGVANFSGERLYTELLGKADKALYQVKGKGKNTHQIYDNEISL